MVTFLTSYVSNELRLHRAQQKAEKARLESLHPGDPKRAEQELEDWRGQHVAPRATLAQVADHIDHIRKVAGIDHIGLGSDFDGMSSAPDGLKDVSAYPALLAELLKRGYTREDVSKVAGLNVLRVMRGVESIAQQLRSKTTPCEAQLEPHE